MIHVATERYRGFVIEFRYDPFLGPCHGCTCRWWSSLCRAAPVPEPFPNVGIAFGVARREIDGRCESEAAGVFAGAAELVRRQREEAA
jgi:hypothetical protein